ncbi:speckle-type POZ protein [Trichonephila clavipes]|nr:speckle-type POZ protein [Trichonephila clavipes]
MIKLFIAKDDDDEIRVYIVNFSDRNTCTVRYKISVLDCVGATVHSIEDDYVFSSNREEGNILTLIEKFKLMERKDLILPNDELTLQCECSSSGGVEYNGIEETIYGPPSVRTTNLMMRRAKEHLSQINNSEEYIKCTTSSKTGLDLPVNPTDNVEKPSPVQQCNATSSSSVNGEFPDSLRNDILSLFQKETLCDFTLSVDKENLRAHKAVLCVRSPVFKAMLTTEMKETVNQLMEIHDLEVNTVRHMLNFMYTDTTDNLDWDTASKFYIAADKYDVAALKRLCSTALKAGLCVANIGKILRLSDKHADDDLRKSVHDFIYDNDAEILSSHEWNSFMQKEVQQLRQCAYCNEKSRKTRGHGTTPLRVKEDIEDVSTELGNEGLKIALLG